MQLKIFVKCLPSRYVGSVQQVLTIQQLTSKRLSSSTSSEAKPISECPTVTSFEFMRGLLPGGKFYKKDSSKFLNIIMREKGDVIYMPGILGKPNAFITQNPNDFEIVFRNEGIWPTRDGMELMHYHRNVHRKDYFGEKSGLLTSQGKEWADFRNAVNQVVIHPKNIKIYLPVMSEVNADFIERIKKIRDPQTHEVPENFVDEIGCWTLESVAVVALDRKLGLLSGANPESLRISKNFIRYFEIAMDVESKPPFWRYLPNRKVKEVMTILDEIVEISEKYINEAIARIKARTTEKPENEQSILEKLLKIDEKIAKIMAMELLLAAVDTTTTTITGLLLCLAKNPEKQEKLRKEILAILPHKDSPLTVENMKNMPYLRACLKESLRVYPLTIGNIRSIPKELVLSGYRVPKDTNVIMIVHNLQKDEQHYSSPNEFIPERWLRQSPQSAENESASSVQCPHATKSSNAFVYMPFGFGPRSCIGRRIAELELEIGIMRILRNFQVKFNYSTENAFKLVQINVPNIPLKFKFTDLPY